MKNCKHTRTRRGKEIDLLHGSRKTTLCLDCKKWREVDHFNLPVSRWKKKEDGYKEATADKPDLW